MAIILEVSGKALAVGLDWSVNEDRKRLAEALRELGKSASVITRPVDDGLLLGASAEKVGKNPIAGALVIAAVFPDAVVLHDLGDGTAWVCGVAHGSPMPGSDHVLPTEEAQSAVASLMSANPPARIVGTADGAVASVEDALGQVTAKKLKLMRLRQNGLDITKVVVLSTVPLVMMGAVAGALQWKKMQEEAEMLRLMEAAAAAERARSQLQATRNADAQLIKLQEAAKSVMQGVPADQQLGAWVNALNSIPKRHEGYRLETARCELVAPGPTSCLLTWRGIDRAGLRPSPFSALSLPGKPEANLNTDPALLVSSVKSRIDVPGIDHRELPLDPPEGVFQAVDRFRRIGLDLRPAAAAPVSVPTPGAPLDPKGQPTSMTVIGKKGTWRIEGSSLMRAHAAVDALHGTGWRLRVMSISGLADGRVRFSLEGDYVLSP